MINLEEHKIFVESLNMEVVPLSIAIQALQETNDINNTKYFNELDNAVNELQTALKDIDLDD